MPDDTGTFADVIEQMEQLKEERGVPRNVKELIDMAIEELRNDEEDASVRVQTATSLLDQVSNDLNLTQYTRTQVWNIASQLESRANDE